MSGAFFDPVARALAARTAAGLTTPGPTYGDQVARGLLETVRVPLAVGTAEPSGTNYGTKILDIGTATATPVGGNTAGNTIVTAFSTTPATVVKSATGKGMALQPSGYVTFSPASIDLSGNKWLGFWAWKPAGTPVAGWSIYVSSNALSTFARVTLSIYPGLHFYKIPIKYGVSNAPWMDSGAGISVWQAVNRIRFRADAADGTTLPFITTGDTILVGDIYVDPPAPRKPRFYVGFDDCKSGLLVPFGPAVVGGDGASQVHSYATFAQSYGFPVNAYIISGAVGASGYLKAHELADAQDKFGIRYGCHSHSHPNASDVSGADSNAGLRLLGPHGYTLTSGAAFTATQTGLSVTPANDTSAITTDVETAIGLLNKWGIRDATQHFASPQGGFDQYVNAAIESFGFKSNRGINYRVYQPVGGISTAAINNDDNPSLTSNLQTSVQTDNAAVADATITSYVDDLISWGADGSSYCHTWGSNTTAQAKTKLLFDYLATKTGSIDIVGLY